MVAAAFRFLMECAREADEAPPTSRAEAN